MKNINSDEIPPKDDLKRVEEPAIKNRRELHQFLESVMTRTYELEREYGHLEEDLNMVKSFIIESHSPLDTLTVPGYNVWVSRTDDPTLSVVTFRKDDVRKFSTLYVDTLNERFWTVHTVEKSAVVNPFIDRIARNEIEKDYVWFPCQYLERFKERGSPRGLTIQYSELLGDNHMNGNLSLKLWGSAAGCVLELFRQLSHIKTILPDNNSHILEICEELSHSSPLSGIEIKYLLDGGPQFVLDNIAHKGKFTARGGNSIDGHLYLLRSAKKDYATTIEYIEEEIAMEIQKGRPLTLRGYPLTIALTRPIKDLSSFSQELVSCRYPFRFLGFPRYEFDDFIAITGVDLHTGGKVNVELSQDWIRLYLLKGSCGNTVARFYSVIQHNYDSDAKLEGIEYGRLF